MNHSRSATYFCLLLGVLLTWHGLWAQPAVPAPTTIRSLHSLFDFPLTEEQDLRALHQLCRTLQPALAASQERMTVLDRIAAFTAIAPGEQWRLVSFAQSDDRALRKLREELHLPVPAGSVLVRLYPTKADLPPPLRAMFGEDTAGLNWGRFIVVLTADRADDAIADTLSHELTHAWLAALTADKPALPKWFNEGVAEYLSRAKGQYAWRSGDLLWIERSSPEYADYLLTFRYLEATLGEAGVAEFIRTSVFDGIPAKWADYDKLRAQARAWQSARAGKTWLTGAAIGLIGLLLLARRTRRRARQQQAQGQQELLRTETVAWQSQERAAASLRNLEEAETVEEFIASEKQAYQSLEAMALALVREARALLKIRQRKQAEQKLAQAFETAPWSQPVRSAAQTVRNEMYGIYR